MAMVPARLGSGQEPIVGDLFREIDEELRQERFEKLWQAYGKYAIGIGIPS